MTKNSLLKFCFVHIFQSRVTSYNRIYDDFKIFVESKYLVKYRKILAELVDFEMKNKKVFNLHADDKYVEMIYKYQGNSQIYRIINDQKLIKKVVISNKLGLKLAHQIPPRYWRFFVENEIKINKWKCCFLWLFCEALEMLKQWIVLVRNCFIPVQDIELPYGSTLIFGLNKESLIKESKKEMCFEKWLQQSGVNINYSYAVDVEVHPVGESSIKSISEKNLFSYSVKNFAYFCLTLLLYKCGFRDKYMLFRYSHEIFKAWFLRVEVTNRTGNYLWLSSLPWVKPLWKSGSNVNNARVIFVNLSSADTPRVLDNEIEVQYEHLNLWDEVWVVDDYQGAKYQTREVVVDQKIVAKGVPYWTDNINAFRKIDGLQKYCAIFDLQPSRQYLGWSSLNDVGFIDFESSLKFINDIVDVCYQLGILCVHKQKRKNARYLDAEYSAGLIQISRIFDNYTEIEPDTSPHRIIAKSFVTISMPFTSTGLIASSYGVPNFFYDPIGKVSVKDPARREIEIINTQNYLSEKIRNLLY